MACQREPRYLLHARRYWPLVLSQNISHWPVSVFLTKRVAIGRASQPFPRSKPSARISTHSAFQLGLWTFLREVRGMQPRGNAPSEGRHNPLHCVPRCAGEQGAPPSTVICFSRSPFQKVFDRHCLADLPLVSTITVEHVIPTLPPSSSPHAGIFASITGRGVQEVPRSDILCDRVLSPSPSHRGMKERSYSVVERHALPMPFGSGVSPRFSPVMVYDAHSEIPVLVSERRAMVAWDSRRRPSPLSGEGSASD